MATWLTTHGYPVPVAAADLGVDLDAMGAQTLADEHNGHGDHGMGHDDMPGMATPDQLEQLAAARGAEADLLFLDLMTAHHEGALTMVSDHAQGASDIQAQEVATEISAEQQAEIGRMADLRARLTG